MLTFVFAYFMVQTGSCALAADSDAVDKDTTLFQGEWAMVSGVAEGAPIPDAACKQIRQVFKGDQMTGTISGTMYWKLKFVIDPSKSPKTIDYAITGGPAAGSRQMGIYEIDGDTCKLCVGKLNGGRPKSFDAGPHSGDTASTWKRVKPVTPAKGS